MLHCDKKAVSMEHTVLSAKSDVRLDIWHARISEHAAEIRHLEKLLSTAEQERAGRFRRDADRQSFIVGRGLLRQLLGGYLDQDPTQLPIAYGPSGKPQVEGGIEFNLSHSGDRLLFSFTHDAPVGVDIQHIDPAFPWRQVAEEVLSMEEMARFLVLSGEQQQAEFYLHWVMKEAISKAEGAGLGRPFPSFCVSDWANKASGQVDVGNGYLAAWAMELTESVAVRVHGPREVSMLLR